MAAVVVDPNNIREFKSEQAFEKWLSKNHGKAPEVYLRIYKKDSRVPSVTIKEALDVVLCWGWIDGIRKGYDDKSYLQRYTPRRPKSVWSKINVGHVERLIAAKRMTPHGQRHIELAKADGRWDAAYAGAATMTVPPDLLAAIEQNAKASAMFASLDKTNLYSLAWRLRTLKTEAGRQKRIASFVEMLARGETVHPMSARVKKPAR